jgi:hypothetical protein
MPNISESFFHGIFRRKKNRPGFGRFRYTIPRPRTEAGPPEKFDLT